MSYYDEIDPIGEENNKNKHDHTQCIRCDEWYHEDFIKKLGLCEHCNDDLDVII